MRTAILFAPLSSDSGASGPRRAERVSALERALSPLGFRVVHTMRRTALADLERSLAEAGGDDSVLVHVSGELKSSTELFLGPDESISLSELRRLVAEVGPASTFIVAELAFTTEPDDAFALAEDLAEIRAAFTTEAPGHPALIGLHGASNAEDGLGFTELCARAATELLGDGRDVALASEVVDRLREMPESQEVARSYAFVRGCHDFDLALPSDEILDAPDAELLVELAQRAREVGSLPHALAGYRAALLACRDDEQRAPVYGLIASAERAIGRPGHARRAYHKALKARPGDAESLDALIDLETEAEEWAKVAEAMRDRIPLFTAPAEKVSALFSLARLTVEKLRDMDGAVQHLEAARAIDGKDEDVLEALRRSYRVLGRWSQLVDVTGALADQAATATERAARHFARAQIAKTKLQDPAGAKTYLKSALEADPTHDEALDVFCELRTASGEEALLEGELTALLHKLFEIEEEERALDVAKRISALRDENPRRADTTEEITEDQIEEVEEEKEEEIDEDDEEVRAELEGQVSQAPLVAANHAALLAIYQRAGLTDRAYLSALALEELGAADSEAEKVLDRWRPVGLRMRSPIDAEAWALLRAPGRDEVLEDLFRSIGRAASVVRLEERKAKKRLIVLDEARRQTEDSTASIVRTFHWAAEILDVECPALYVLDRVPGDLVAIPAATPKTAMGPSVLTGLTTIDLAFLCGRHLTYYRPEYSALIDFPTLNELSLLMLAALKLALPAMPVPPSVGPTVAFLRNGLKTHLTAEEREAMSEAVGKLDARGGRVNLQAWIRHVELTAARVGLLLSGDLGAAMTRMRNETRSVADLSVDARRLDLLSFCTTGGLASLRERFFAPHTLRPPRESGFVGRAPYVSAIDRGDVEDVAV
jgi:tetratricopeptide (TPR) repeat protein